MPAAGKNLPPCGRRALSSPLAVAVFLAVAGAGAAADLLSKHYVFRSMLDRPSVEQQVRRKLELFEARSIKPTPEMMLRELNLHRQVIPGMRFTLSTNPGVVFGLRLPASVTLVTTVLTMVLVAVFFALGDKKAWPMHLALGLILAGAIGNLYDRAFHAVWIPAMDQPIRQQVRDFVDCSQLFYPYIFNVADALLVLGVLIPLGWWTLGGGKSR